MEHKVGIAGTIARGFIDSKITPLVILASLLLGLGSIVLLLREIGSSWSRAEIFFATRPK